jgi:Holliday junction resolvase RusA-like endonuclease
MTEYVFTVPDTPPSLNHYTGARAGGGRFKHLAATRYGMLVGAEWNKHSFYGPIEAKEYAIDILVQLQKGRKGRQPDVDGFAKVGLDALVQAGIILDDVRVTDLSLHKQWGDCVQTTYTITVLR